MIGAFFRSIFCWCNVCRCIVVGQTVVCLLLMSSTSRFKVAQLVCDSCDSLAGEREYLDNAFSKNN